MIVRLLIAAFGSLLGGVCYLADMNRLMSGLIIGFGVMTSLFFGLLFSVPGTEDIVGFPLYGRGGALPFFLLAVVLAGLMVYLFFIKPKDVVVEQVGRKHFIDLGCGLLCYLLALFIPATFWFPSEKVKSTESLASMQGDVLIGTVIFLLLVCAALVLLWRASKGGSAEAPNMMRKITLALFAFFQLDKIPFLTAYLLIYSPETGVVFPLVALAALSAYLLEALFLLLVTRRKMIVQG